AAAPQLPTVLQGSLDIMDYLTMRLLFSRDTVLSLLDEPGFEGCVSLTAQRDVKPFSDIYLTVFVLEVEPAPGCGLRLRPISTTAVGMTRTSAKRLIGHGFVWADTRPGEPNNASLAGALPR